MRFHVERQWDNSNNNNIKTNDNKNSNDSNNINNTIKFIFADWLCFRPGSENIFVAKDVNRITNIITLKGI